LAEPLPDVKQKIQTPRGAAWAFNPLRLKERGYDVETLPYSIRVLLENALRHSGRVSGAAKAAEALASWPKRMEVGLPFMPYRVLMQDYTGVPLVVDLAGMRAAAGERGLKPTTVDSKVPVDLVIDHSIQVDAWGSDLAFNMNLQREYDRNSERYSLLKWARSEFRNMRVFPPGKGICHQFNLEYLAQVVTTAESGGELHAFPDTLVGTDSHTTMVNGLGVLGWGVGGIEAEAVMLGEPYQMPLPRVLGVKFTGNLQEGVTPTDLVLTVTEKLRERNLVGDFVEYFGEGYRQLSVADRATIGNMSPEYGATVGYSPIDDSTLSYLSATSRERSQVEFVRRYAGETGLFLSEVEPKYSEVLAIELDRVEPSISGPRNPEERHSLKAVPSFAKGLLQSRRSFSAPPVATVPVNPSDSGGQLMLQRPSQPTSQPRDGIIVIAAITSCTNTSNPTVMVGAGLLARNAAQRGLKPKPWVKCSMAPGSSVVTDYLQNSELLPFLDMLGFNVIGYGCTTCIGNSGPLSPEVEREIKERDLYAVAVLSGNRNFDGRIHPLVQGSFLMSPMLVIAYALAGRIDFDLYSSPLGTDREGRPVYLTDIWPSQEEVRRTVERSTSAELFSRRYSEATKGDDRWDALVGYTSDTYRWESGSTYVRRPPWLDPKESRSAMVDIRGARILALLGDKVTTDHISPAGTIPVDSPAGKYLVDQGVDMLHFGTYGSRRGNHELMVRGGFSNIRLKNEMARGKEGGWTALPSGELVQIFDAARRYASDGVPLVVIAGKQYGAGSSRDWAAKAPRLLGVRAVIAESFERIHRSNLTAMGILPLQFREGEGRLRLGLKGDESIDISGIAAMTEPNELLEVTAKGRSGERKFKVLCRIDNATEMQYVQSGGVLPYVFSRLHQSVH